MGASKLLFLKDHAENAPVIKDSRPQPTKAAMNTKGQSIVEITLITPLLLAALYVAFDFGIAFFAAHYAQNAVREGTRMGSILPDCSVVDSVPCVAEGNVTESCPGSSPVVQATCARLPALLETPQVSVTLTGAVGSTCRRTITTEVEGGYNYGFYRMMALIGKPPAATSTKIIRAAEARYELQPVTYTNACP